MAGGGAVVCGHSLGGALAQLTAVHLSGVGRVVTFQSPGIDQADADTFKKKQSKKGESDRIKSSHYRKDGDLLHAAGDALTDGDVFRFHSRGIDNPMAHTHFPLARLNQARGGLVPGITGKGQEAATENLTRVERTTTGEEKGDLSNRFVEGGRKFLGGALRKDNQDAYTQLWKSTEMMVQSGKYSSGRIEAVIESSQSISIEQKARMRTQAHQMLESRNT
jgi:pimeloyl-ACP methyl ester carboxylesterase